MDTENSKPLFVGESSNQRESIVNTLQAKEHAVPDVNIAKIFKSAINSNIIDSKLSTKCVSTNKRRKPEKQWMISFQSKRH